MSGDTFLAALFFPCAAVVIVFFMKYVSAILQARVRMGQDEAYRAVALKAAAAQAETAAALTDIRSELAAVMKILKAVE
jgi:hypothetical protein